jgi:hypothetical protein
MEWRRLDGRALTFGRGELSKGRTLARLCLPLLDTSQPWARVPANWQQERPYEFQRGNVSPGPEISLEQLIPTDVFWAFLEGSSGDAQNVFVFEDPYARPTDEGILSSHQFTPVVFMDDDVYQVIDDSLVGDAMHFPLGEYPIIGIATVAPPGAPLEDGKTITLEALSALATDALAIIVAAWDAENYVVFDRGLLDLSRPSRGSTST